MTAIAVNPEMAVANCQNKNTMITKTAITYRSAVDKDLPAILTLLKEAGLPTMDITPGVQQFFIGDKNSRIVGVIGIECYHDIALLRSMAVSSDHRNGGIASHLVEQLLSYAGRKGMRKIYLVTNTAESYFAKKGFGKIERKEVDKNLEASAELNGLCPASSVIMMKSLS
jgi:amino-acid N-acetyltransferase